MSVESQQCLSVRIEVPLSVRSILARGASPVGCITPLRQQQQY